MAYIGEMQYLTIGNNTYSLPTGGGGGGGIDVEVDPVFSASPAAGITAADITNWNGKGSGTVTSVGVANATNGGLSISGSPITSSGSITVGHSNVLSSAQTTQAVYPIKIDKNGHISAYGSAVTIPTKTSDLTNDSGFITSYTDEKLKWTASTSSNTYYPLQSTSTATTSTANTLNGISFYQYYNTAGGYRRLDLGNSTAYKSTGGAYGTIRLYGAAATYYGDLVPGVLGTTSGDGHISANRTWTLPDKTGTIALTSDIPDVSSFITVDEKVKQSNNTTSNANLRILFSQSAIDTDQTSTVYKSTNLTYNPSTKTLSTDNLQTTQINGVTVGSSPKFTDTNTISAWYGTCSSNSTTETKIVSCSGFTLSTGALIAVHFSSGNQLGGAIKLNVNSTGDKPIYYKGAAVSTSNMLYWQNDENILFSYDGTNYQYVSNSFVVNEIGSSTSVSILLSTDAGNKYKSSNLSFSSGASSNSPQLIIGDSSTSTGILTLGNNGKQISITPTTLSASRTITLPDKTGTVALTSDIPDVSSFITVDENVKQVNTTGTDTYRILFSYNANDNTETVPVRKSKDLKFTTTTGNLQTIQLNGVTVGSSPKFTDSEVSTLTLASGSTAGTSLSFGSKYTLTAGSKTVSFTMPSSPTVPTITLNGSSTTSPSFYAPTSAGTSGYVLKSNGSGAPSWVSAVLTDENVKSTAVTAATTNYLVGSTTSTTTTGGLSKHASGVLYTTADTATSGYTQLRLGNTTATSSAGGKEGQIRLYGTNATYYLDLKPGAIASSNKTITFPNKDGTVALIPTEGMGGPGTKAVVYDTVDGFVSIKGAYFYQSTSNNECYLSLGGNGGAGKGSIKLHTSDTNWAVELAPINSLSADRTITLPDKDGTVALTSDIPTVPTITDTYSSTSSNGMSGKAVASALGSYLPLRGGTMTGNIIMDGLGILGKSSINDNANYLLIGLNKTDNYIYVGSSDGRTAGIPVGIYGSNIYLGTNGDLTLSGNLTVDGTTVKIGLGTSEALYTAINTAGWVSSVIVS